MRRSLLAALLASTMAAVAAPAAAQQSRRPREYVSSGNVEGNKMMLLRRSFHRGPLRGLLDSKNAGTTSSEVNANAYRDVFLRTEARQVPDESIASSAGRRQTIHFSDVYSNGSPISADGRYVVFSASLDNLVSFDGNGHTDVRSDEIARRQDAENQRQLGGARGFLRGFQRSRDLGQRLLRRFSVDGGQPRPARPERSPRRVHRDRRKGVTKRVSVNSSEQEAPWRTPKSRSRQRPSTSSSGRLGQPRSRHRGRSRGRVRVRPLGRAPRSA